MKKTIISILLLSFGIVALAQSRQGGRDDNRGHSQSLAPQQQSRPQQVQQSRPAPQQQVQQSRPQQVVVNKAPAPKPAPIVVNKTHSRMPTVVYKKPAPVIVYNKKPEPKRFVVKGYHPRPTVLGSIFRVLAPRPYPTSRAVVVYTSTQSNPVYEMTELDREPALIESPSINYPENMANAGIDGEVTMMVQIDKNGYVGLEQVISSTNSTFEKEAIASLSTFRYEEPLRNGRPVNARFSLTIPFEISD